MDSLDQEKRALRAEVRARIPRAGSPEQVAASVAAQERLASSDLAARARVVGLYRALPTECGLGIEDPTGAPVALDEIDLLVVPAIAVDARGRRLGRGKGHYDATLLASRAFSVALVFEAQLVPSVPVGEHDRPVSAVCTEARLIIV